MLYIIRGQKVPYILFSFSESIQENFKSRANILYYDVGKGIK